MNVYIVMGTCGTGKSTIGKLLAEKLGVPHYDGDDYHPQSNLDKMSLGHPLDDKDREPWLLNLAEEIEKWSKGKGAVLSCSALKEKYRTLLSSKVDKIEWVVLEGSRELIADRLANRKDHFFDTKLLDSQLRTLEIPVYGIHVNIKHTPEQIIQTILKQNI